jgi:Uncharacterised nucleotidyltransferase
MAWQLESACPEMLERALLNGFEGVFATVPQCICCLRRTCSRYCASTRNGYPRRSTKGPGAQQMLFDDISWRESSDLDVLVRRADITRAKETLLAANYQLQSQLPSGEESAAFHWRSDSVARRCRRTN